MKKEFEAYEFKTEPYDHRRTGFRDSWSEPAYALFMEMGTGKSKIVVDTIGLLREVGEVECVLIVAPKGVYHNWVRKEIGPIASPDLLQWAPGLPKTRSGKIMRRILRKIAENDYSNLGDTSTLADPSVVEHLIENRKNRG